MRMILETDRLILRGWEDSDAASLFKYASDSRIGLSAGWLPHADIKYSRAVIRAILSREETYAICLKGNANEPIGNIGLNLKGSPKRPLLQGEAELGFWVGHPYWGRGIAPEAVKEILRHGFFDLGLKRVYCGYFKGNDNSKKVQQKCGFKFHHIENETYIIMLDETRVEYINVITNNEFLLFHKKDTLFNE
ncbi:MAG: GNAT family N-acetyltransferase [Butyrivibrio sp.]|nr:GNAT family N-acetyltransferase [Butyrivibrio sp.]